MFPILITLALIPFALFGVVMLADFIALLYRRLGAKPMLIGGFVFVMVVGFLLYFPAL